MRRSIEKVRIPSWAEIAGLLLTGLLVGMAPSPPAHAQVLSNSSAAVAKIVATMEAAVASAPEVRRRVAGLNAESSEVLSGLGPGTPYFSWQREGVGGGFEYKPNGVEYFRVSTPFNLPWRISDNRDVREYSETLLDLGSRAAALDVAGRVGQAWIDLAATTEKAQVAQVRLARLQRAIEIQRKKFELGEISGSEKTQLEIELARDAAAMTQVLVDRRALEEMIAAWTVSDFPRPVAGDMAWLEDGTASKVGRSGSTREPLDSGPLNNNVWIREADSRSVLAQAESELIRSTAWGRPEIDVEWERIPDFDGIGGYDAFGFRIGVPIHLGKAGKRKVTAAEFRAEAVAAERDRLRRDLKGRLEATLAALDANALILTSLEPVLDEMPATEFSLSEQFRLGAVSYLVYLDGLARLDEVRLQVIEARRGLLSARLELAELTADGSYFPTPGLIEEQPDVSREPASSTED